MMYLVFYRWLSPIKAGKGFLLRQRKPYFWCFSGRTSSYHAYAASCTEESDTATATTTTTSSRRHVAARAQSAFWVQWTDPVSASVYQRRVIGSLFASSSAANSFTEVKVDRGSEDPSGVVPKSEERRFCFDAEFVDDSTSAKEALKLLRDYKQTKKFKACNRVLIYRGHYENARQLLSALQRRCRKLSTSSNRSNNTTPTRRTLMEEIREEWRMHRRMAQQEAADVNRLLVEVKCPHILSRADGSTMDRGSEDSLFCSILNAPIDSINRALQPLFVEELDQSPPSTRIVSETDNNNRIMMADQPESQSQHSSSYFIPLREILARIGNDQWRQKGVHVPQLENYIHPNFDVYPPTRQEYLDLLPHHLLSSNQPIHRILDVGTGTGILAAIMLYRHPHSVAVATDTNPRAIQCASENMERLGYRERVQLYTTSLFPFASSGTNGDGGDDDVIEPFDLLLCNPPWIPDAAVSDDATALSWMDRAIYDDLNSGMLYGFLAGAAGHMRDHNSEVWLILSDLAEHIKLRSREELRQRVQDGGLEIVEMRQVQKKNSATLPNSNKKRRDKVQREEEILYPNLAAARKAETTFLYRLRLQKR